MWVCEGACVNVVWMGALGCTAWVDVVRGMEMKFLRCEEHLWLTFSAQQLVATAAGMRAWACLKEARWGWVGEKEARASHSLRLG